MIRTIFFTIIFGVSCTGFLFPKSVEQNPVHFERLTVDDGLASSSVLCMIQDHRGFLWLGTENGGLQKYDGYRFTTYRNIPADTNSLSNNTIWSIAEDAEGILWIGTAGSTLNKFDPDQESFTRLPCRSNDIKPGGHENLFTTCVDHKGNVWVGSYGQGLFRYDRVEKIFVHFSTKQGLNANSVRALLPIGNNLWIGTYAGLNKMDLSTRSITSYQSQYPNGPGSQAVYALYTAQPDILWLTGQERGLYQLNTLTNEFTHYPVPENDSLKVSQSFFYDLCSTPDGHLWLASRGGGLIRFDPGQETFRRFVPQSGDPNSLSNDIVQSLLPDVAGTLWIGTNNGLNKIDPWNKPFHTYNQQLYGSGGFSDNTVWSITEDSAGHLWIGTWNGLNRYEPATGKFEVFKTHDTSTIRSNVILALRTDKQGNVWAGTWLGLSKYNPSNKDFTTFMHDPADSSSLSNNSVFVIAENSDGFLWLGTNNGVNRFDPATGKAVAFWNREIHGSDRIRSLLVHSGGKLWVGTKRGLFTLDPDTRKFTHIPLPEDQENSRFGVNYITALMENGNQNIWIGTKDKGLKKMPQGAGEFRPVNENSFREHSICGIRADRQGKLWISTTNGLFNYDPDTRRSKPYDQTDGLQSKQFNYGAHYKNKNGRLFFGGSNGFSSFIPEQIRANTHIPPVVFTGFQVFNKPVPIGKDHPLSTHINNTETITLSYDQSVFSFEMAALNYTNPGKNQYAYLLEGFDQHWNDLGHRRFITFTNLDPGEYTLRVKASNNDGVWNEKGASIRIVITPPFWQTWWFRTAMVLGILMIVYGFFRIRVLTYNRDVVREIMLRFTSKIKPTQYLVVKINADVTRIDCHQIKWIKAEGNYVNIVTSGKPYLIRTTIKVIEKKLPVLVQEQFVRIHRSYIVNINKVDTVYKNALMIGPDEIPIGISYQKLVKDLRKRLELAGV